MIGAITLCGQTSGTINGTVRDASGALVPGAKVDARSTTSGERRETTSRLALDRRVCDADHSHNPVAMILK